MDEIKSSLNYVFKVAPLSELDLPHKIWTKYGKSRDSMMVYRTSKGTGLVYVSDCLGNYDENGVYQSCWYNVEYPNGGLTANVGAMSWDKAIQQVEELLGESE